MGNKIIVGIVVALLSGGLIYGAINRTQAKSEHTSGETATRQYANQNEPRATSNGSGAGRASDSNRRGSGQVSARQGARNEAVVQPREEKEMVGAAQVTERVVIQGKVQEVSEESILILTDQGDELIIEGMPLRFAQEAGFTTAVDKRVELTGFYENGEFEVAKIVDLFSGLAIDIREDTGRPLWAGERGRRGL
jgi:hypothetical protein